MKTEANFLKKLNKIDLSDHYNPKNYEYLKKNFNEVINEIWEYLKSL